MDADYYDGRVPYRIVGQEDEYRFLLVPHSEVVDLKSTKARILDLATGKLYRDTPIARILTQGVWHDYMGSQEHLPGYLDRVKDLQA